MSTAVAEKLSTYEVTALNNLLDEFVDHMLKSDWDAVLDTMTDDIEMMPPDEPAATSKAAVRKWLKDYPPIRKFELKLVHAEGHSELATGRGTFTITVHPRGGNQQTMKGKWIANYRKAPDGKWLCASQIWNYDAPVKTD